MVNPLLSRLGEDVMGFLNEIQIKYPNAISLASGRPDERYFDIRDFASCFNLYVDTVAREEGKEREAVLNNLGQYNRTKGIINQLLVKYLKNDEELDVRPEDVIVTVGTQEAMILAVTTLCDREKDVIIVEDPTYVGLPHFAIIAGYQVAAVGVNKDGICLQSLEEKITYFKELGKQVKAVYVIPDYQNPTGNSMPDENRHKLLDLSAKHNFYILEDNAYGDYNYQGKRSLPLKALDKDRRVIYMRSFSKTLYPSLRLGLIVADQQVQYQGAEVALSELITKTKGYTTVNTPSISQAVMGGLLIKHHCSLSAVNTDKVAAIRNKRDLLLAALDACLSAAQFPGAKDISWNIPEGGFFITINTPFKVDKNDVILCAERYGVIFTPMSFFYLNGGGDNDIRLAFSYLSPDDIVPAIERLTSFFKYKLNIN
ncbi:PLP-dependent aminotransferase family protein [Chitinophaga sp. GbtcB8]|uniref:aminotransferase-like domain-containing protein n=1 Tax=Chitinophaga sp. GbtcB8 TaxID=2824753 RepID=UPI001C2FEF79|nr:PLP-dependent aminotransferase family protein [Chitinophaga sp. GbtcB8]